MDDYILYDRLFNIMMEYVPLSREQREYLADDKTYSMTQISNIISFKWNNIRRRDQLEILELLGELNEN